MRQSRAARRNSRSAGRVKSAGAIASSPFSPAMNSRYISETVTPLASAAATKLPALTPT